MSSCLNILAVAILLLVVPDAGNSNSIFFNPVSPCKKQCKGGKTAGTVLRQSGITCHMASPGRPAEIHNNCSMLKADSLHCRSLRICLQSELEARWVILP